MSALKRVAAFGSRSTISGWAAISPSPKSSRFAHHRVHRRLDYPASLGLDQRDGDALLLGTQTKRRRWQPAARGGIPVPTRIPASERTSQKLEELLTQGVADGDARAELLKASAHRDQPDRSILITGIGRW